MPKVMLDFDVFCGFELGIRHVDGEVLAEASQDLEDDPTDFHFGVLISFVCFTLLIGFRK